MEVLVSRSPPLFGVAFLPGRLVGVAAGVTAGLVCVKILKAWIGDQRDKQLPPLVSLSRQDVAKFWLEGLFWKACLLAAKEAEEVWGTRVLRGAGLFETEKVYCVDPATRTKFWVLMDMIWTWSWRQSWGESEVGSRSGGESGAEDLPWTWSRRQSCGESESRHAARQVGRLCSQDAKHFSSFYHFQ